MWDFVDQISVITIDENRIKEIRKNLEKANIYKCDIYLFDKVGERNSPENVKFENVVSYDEKSCGNVCKSLYQSHIKVIEDAYVKNKKNILVLEDDVIFVDNISPQKMKKIASWLESSSWESFYFGGIVWGKNPISIPINVYFMKVFNVLCGHCVLFSRKGMKKILQNHKKYSNFHVDKFYDIILTEKFLCYPNICYQKTNPALFTDVFGLDEKSNYFNNVVKVSNFFSYFSIFFLLILSMVILCFFVVLFLYFRKK